MIPTGSWLVGEIEDNADFEIGYIPFPAPDGPGHLHRRPGLGSVRLGDHRPRRTRRSSSSTSSPRRSTGQWIVENLHTIPPREVDTEGLDVSPLFAQVLEDTAELADERRLRLQHRRPRHRRLQRGDVRRHPGRAHRSDDAGGGRRRPARRRRRRDAAAAEARRDRSRHAAGRRALAPATSRRPAAPVDHAGPQVAGSHAQGAGPARHPARRAAAGHRGRVFLLFPMAERDLLRVRRLQRHRPDPALGRPRQLHRAGAGPRGLGGVREQRHLDRDRHDRAAGPRAGARAAAVGRAARERRSTARRSSCRTCCRRWPSASSGAGSTSRRAAGSTSVLDGVGLDALTTGWLGDPDTALYAVLATAIWATVGFVFVILLSALRNVDLDLVDAARLDGANGCAAAALRRSCRRSCRCS